jgi:hypothetical protein
MIYFSYLHLRPYVCQRNAMCAWLSGENTSTSSHHAPKQNQRTPRFSKRDTAIHEDTDNIKCVQ